MELQDLLEHRLQLYYSKQENDKDPDFIVCHPQTRWEFQRIIGTQIGWLRYNQSHKYRGIPLSESIEVPVGEFRLVKVVE